MKTEKEIREWAKEKSQFVVERTYVNGNSTDTKRAATKTESKNLEAILFGGLYAIEKCKGNKQTVMDTCEMIGHGFLPGINCYDTIYNQFRGE
jgi:hypothetical protein